MIWDLVGLLVSFDRMLLLLLIHLLCFQPIYPHSGLYLVNTTLLTKDYAASWLVSKNRFLNAEKNIKLAKDLETATFRVTRQNCKNCNSLKTRDFFDFMVEHMSPYTNHVPNLDPALFSLALKRVDATVLALKHSKQHSEDKRLDQTVAILIYSSNSFSMSKHKMHKTIRPAFFQATFWSVYRYIKQIVVYVASSTDANVVKSMDLPYTLLTTVSTSLDFKNRTALLSRDSLLHVLEGFKTEDPTFVGHQYVFFSEGDQILHLRESKVLFDTIDNSGGSFLVVPHRMQTLTLAQDFPEELRFKWPAVHAQNIPGMPIARGSIDGEMGSCCQNGDVDVAPCTGWWYQCPTYGIRDFKTWLKFGETGLTMPPVTAHREVCEYSEQQRLCPMPVEECGGIERLPKRSSSDTWLTKLDYCQGIDTVTRLGYGSETQ